MISRDYDVDWCHKLNIVTCRKSFLFKNMISEMLSTCKINVFLKTPFITKYLIKMREIGHYCSINLFVVPVIAYFIFKSKI